MKSTLYHIKLIVIPIFVTFFMFSCREMDSLHEDFIVKGGLLYPGKVQDAIVAPGRNRVQFSWRNSSNPLVKKARIFWNNYADSVEVDLLPQEPYVKLFVDNLEEQMYTFFIKTYDNENNVSLPVELICQVYGDNFQESLLTRPISSGQFLDDGKLMINWGVADISNGAFSTEVRYEIEQGKKKTIVVDIMDDETIINDIKSDKFEYRTVFVPDSSSVDTFYTDWMARSILRQLDRSLWKISTDSYAVSSQLPAGGPPEKVIDGDVNTFWHTDHTTTMPNYPHWLKVDLKEIFNIDKVRLISRPGVVNSFKEFIIQGSLDGVNWTDYGTNEFKQIDGPEDFILVGRPRMRYLRIYALRGSSYHASLAELYLFGY